MLSLLQYSAYVPYDVDLLKRGLSVLRGNMGPAINIAFWIFIMITGVYFMIKIISSIGR